MNGEKQTAINWLNIKDETPKQGDEVIIKVGEQARIAIYGGQSPQTGEHLFYFNFQEQHYPHFMNAQQYKASWTCGINEWCPPSAFVQNGYSSQLPPFNSEVIVNYFGEPRIAIFAGVASDEGGELFFDFEFERPDHKAEHDTFIASFAHEIDEWQTIGEGIYDEITKELT